MDELRLARLMVGVKQSKRAIKEGKAAHAYLAANAEERVISPVRELCEEFGIPVTTVDTMEALGAACGIEIGAAAAVALK